MLTLQMELKVGQRQLQIGEGQTEMLMPQEKLQMEQLYTVSTMLVVQTGMFN